MDAKDELMSCWGIDIQEGDKLRRINLPDGWPEEVLTVIGYESHTNGPCLRVSGEIKRGFVTFSIETKNIGVLYERIGSSGHEQTSKNHFDPTRTERGKR